MDSNNLFTTAFLLALFGGLGLQLYLHTRQIRYVFHHRKRVPKAFANTVTPAEHQKAASYTIAKEQLAIVEAFFSTAVLLSWTLLGGLNALHQTLLAWILADYPLLQGLALLGCFAAIGALLDLPFSYYRNFVLEARFGFNKNTPALWLQDLFKTALISAVLGLPIAACVLWLMEHAGDNWWLWAWGTLIGFQFLLFLIFPAFIAPLFNRFTPLQNPDLQTRVATLMHRAGMKSKGFFVMDGSRRSAHANAYFTGVGSSKRVVFYDTLLEKLNPEETEAVLAHELGHFKRQHIRKRLILMLGLSFIGFAFLGWLAQKTWFYLGLGITPNVPGSNNALALILFMLATPVFLFFTTPIMSALSRKHEFEADAYACSLAEGKALASALVKLYQDNAQTLTPDPGYARFYYSHPFATERLARLDSAAA